MRAVTRIMILAPVLLGGGVAVGITLAPRLRARPSVPDLRGTGAGPTPVATRRQESPSPRSDDPGARLALAVATLGQVPKLRPEAPPPAPREEWQHMSPSDLPEGVQTALRQLTLGRPIHWHSLERIQHEGQPYFKAKLELDGVRQKFVLDEQGKVMKSAFDVSLGELPAPVSKGIQAIAPGATLLEAQRKQKGDGQPYFEVNLQIEGQRQELEVTEDGQVMRRRMK
jgi:hypothetical protein